MRPSEIAEHLKNGTGGNEAHREAIKTLEMCDNLSDTLKEIKDGVYAEGYKKGRIDAIDEFLEMLPDCDYVGIETFVCLAEQLKEQENDTNTSN